MKILQNTCLISAVLAWAVAQLCKLLIELIAHHRLDWERLTGDGGMPSGHSATVTALAVAALLQYGAASFQFAISAVLAIIVMHDAMGVRWQAGQHARTINELLLKLSDTPPEQLLEEFLGTPRCRWPAVLCWALRWLFCIPSRKNITQPPRQIPWGCFLI